MKKNKLIVILNWSLLFALPITLLTVNVETNKTSAKISPKKLSTSIMFKTEKSNAIVATNIDEVDNKIEEQEEVKKEVKKVEVTKETQKEETKEEIKEEQKEVVSQPVYEEKSDVLKSYTGKMSFYNANCTGCSGITSTGIDVSDGRLYYYDNNYGNVRIIAAGPEIKKWSIVRLKNTSLGSNTLAIVLDRGGAIGEGRTFLIDMLTNNQEGKGGVEKGVVVEVLRDGK